METIQHIFPLDQAHPPLTPPGLAQEPPSLLVLSTPQMLDSSGEAHVVVDLLDTPEIVVRSSDDDPMEGLKNHLEEEDDLEEDQEIDEIVEE